MIKIIGFGLISLRHLYPLLYFMFVCSKYAYKSLFFQTYIRQTLFYFSYSFQLLLAIIPYLIEKAMSYSSKKSRVNTNNHRIVAHSQFTYIKSEFEKKYMVQYYIYIVLICLLTVIIISCRWIIYENLNVTSGKDAHHFIYDNSFFSACEFILCALFSKLLLKLSIGSHHILSFIIIFLGTGFTALFYLFNYISLKDNTTSNNLLFIIIAAVIKALSGAMQEVCEKWLMEIKFISSYLLLFIEGAFTIALYTIMLLVNWKVKYWPFKQENQFIADIQNLVINSLSLYYAIYICILFGINVFRIKTNESFTPTHKTIGNTLIGIYLLLEFLLIKQIDAQNKWLPILGYSIVLCGSLIYHEIIILYFCNLHMNTTKEIHQRATFDGYMISSVMETQLIDD